MAPPVGGVVLDWRASFRIVRKVLYWVIFMARFLQLPSRVALVATAAGDSGSGSSGSGGSSGTPTAAATSLQVSSWSWMRLLSLRVQEEDGSWRRAVARRRRKSLQASTVWQDRSFANSRGQTIFTQSWTPTDCKRIKGLVVLLHGLNEHSGRYERFATQLNAHAYSVYGMDWIGHGGTDGLHGYVESLDYAVLDTEELLYRVSAELPGIPVFLFGHSTGGAIALKAALRPSVRDLLAGVILTSPALRVQSFHPVVELVAPFFSMVLPRYQFQAANRRRLPVTRDPVEQVAKYTDPLVYTGPIRVRTGTEILKITAFLQKNLQNVSTPFLVLHGTDDKVTDPAGSQRLYEHARSKRKTLKLYEGLLHDLLFEVETDRDVVTKDIIDWLESFNALPM
ncbi:uncharacterized protein LOC9646389 [Selaginella moellendorffii]|nr:uncharacterized protein LOC9646389 [Selaginella moellendorffii]|eukprot:XP_002969883.2 uncharacterized protein LOC9646389 [Selaginella moellendorffii]